jgi:hypothetical protein
MSSFNILAIFPGHLVCTIYGRIMIGKNLYITVMSVWPAADYVLGCDKEFS